MKTLRADLSADGRHDILQKTVAYRGGEQDPRPLPQFTHDLTMDIGYSPEVRLYDRVY